MIFRDIYEVIQVMNSSKTVLTFVGARAEARRPLWNEIRFCERALQLLGHLAGHNSRSFRLV
jgi:hypothetical protein